MICDDAPAWRESWQTRLSRDALARHTEEMATLIDLSHDITAGMTTYPGLPVPEIADHLSRDAAEEIDGPGLTFQIGRPVHTTLRNDIPIIEHLTDLAEVPSEGFEFTAVPPKIEGCGTFTVRAFAMVR